MITLLTLLLGIIKYEHEEITQMIGNNMPSGNYRRIYIYILQINLPHKVGMMYLFRMEKTYFSGAQQVHLSTIDVESDQRMGTPCYNNRSCCKAANQFT